MGCHTLACMVLYMNIVLLLVLVLDISISYVENIYGLALVISISYIIE